MDITTLPALIVITAYLLTRLAINALLILNPDHLYLEVDKTETLRVSLIPVRKSPYRKGDHA